VRGCLSVLLLAGAFMLGAAWFGGPALAEVLIGAGLGGTGFEARATSVKVTSDPPVEVLGGRADRVAIGADGAAFGDLEATRVDLVLTEVDLVGRTFGEVDGLMTGVRAVRDDGVVPVGRVEVSGAARAADAVITMPGDDVERLAAAALNDRLGVPVVGAALSEPDILRFSVANQSVGGRLVVEPDGSLALAVPLPGAPRIILVDPEPLDLASVGVADGDLVLTGTLDLVALLAP
jgi:hypothetical protein